MKKSLFALAIPLLFTACDPAEQNQVSTVETVVSNVTLPDTVELGDTIKIEMTYGIYNNCGVYAGTEATRNGNSILIRPFVTYTYSNNTACPENITYGEETVRFKPEAVGKYFLFFKKSNNAGYDADTVVVK